MNRTSAIVAMSARPGLHARIQSIKRSGLKAAIPRSHFHAAPRAAFSHRCGLDINFADSIPTDKPMYCPGFSSEPSEYWKKAKVWSNVTAKDFISYRWQVANTIDRKDKLINFLSVVVPERIPQKRLHENDTAPFQTREEFLANVVEGMKTAPMAVRLTPHILSVINWVDPVNDPVRCQFIPLKSGLLPDHPKLMLDSLQETTGSPVPGLVHRYPDKALFLATSVCPVYCRFCTRSYAVGANTESVTKTTMKPSKRRWETMFEYIEKTPAIQDIVVSGGDCYYLQPEHLQYIGERLLSIPNIKRFRLASKGLAVCPMRITDRSDGWTDSLVDLSNKGRQIGKQVALHTHFNHPAEITYATELAARYLFQQGVTVRNQTVLLKGVNDDLDTMSRLVRQLADLNVQPYYVYQGDMISGVEDLRTPLSTIVELEKKMRGTIAGFMMPAFVVDLPGGGGKRLANSYETYDRNSGLSTWRAPGVAGDKVFEYYDPV
ncbi:hypothetical protein KC343_g5372 [Hortaea werneckii]|uniref:Radical SAM core domain-containing protein n=1 Tax=Hortaea werneckii TaxID=91943 RepID=A0A3M7HBI7_HORWE|nr:hypothetical protein KC352_g11605 [Hortaea werneckii]KAI7566882.1 hypothetical protein KC317_g5367 [Hortaea werneckii]KAI7618535.1 hypothetical protein KC346_g4960 [Hortaea werneckii]KAI7629197.1 hypothetical protein KC343_g5372 [Hortaea werneckii]KAI7676448.1 hypothetical protein KC319_g4372 [Hortaea werneckii]